MSHYDDIYEVAADSHGLITSREARSLGVSDKEMSRLAGEGRLNRIGRGVYRVRHHVPEPDDPYADAVAAVGEDAYLYGESVLAMLSLAPTNPARIYVATPRRVRRKLPPGVVVVRRSTAGDITAYGGIGSQSAAGAIRSCEATMMRGRLADATHEARRLGYVSRAEEAALLAEIGEEP